MPAIREGATYRDATATCAGCGQDIDCRCRYLTIELDNQDGTLRPTDYAYAHFHGEHCISTALQHAQAVLMREGAEGVEGEAHEQAL